MPIRRLQPPPTPSAAAPSFLERLGGVRGILATGTRVGSGILGSTISAEPGFGTAVGGALGGIGEGLAELIEGSDPSLKRMGVEAALTAVPLGKVFSGARTAAALKSAALAGTGVVGRDWARGEAINPTELGAQTAIGAGLGALLGGHVQAPKAITREEHMAKTRPWVSPKPEGWVPPKSPEEVAKGVVAARTARLTETQKRNAGVLEGKFETALSKKRMTGRTQEANLSDQFQTAVGKKYAGLDEAEAKALEEQQAAERIARKKAGLEKQPPTVSESIKAPSGPGGTKTARTVWKLAEEEGGGGGGSPKIDPMAGYRPTKPAPVTPAPVTEPQGDWSRYNQPRDPSQPFLADLPEGQHMPEEPDIAAPVVESKPPEQASPLAQLLAPEPVDIRTAAAEKLRAPLRGTPAEIPPTLEEIAAAQRAPESPVSALTNFFKNRVDAAGFGNRAIKTAKAAGEAVPEEGRRIAGMNLQREAKAAGLPTGKQVVPIGQGMTPENALATARRTVPPPPTGLAAQTMEDIRAARATREATPVTAADVPTGKQVVPKSIAPISTLQQMLDEAASQPSSTAAKKLAWEASNPQFQAAAQAELVNKNEAASQKFLDELTAQNTSEKNAMQMAMEGPAYVPSTETTTPGVHEMTPAEIADETKLIERAQRDTNFLDLLKRAAQEQKGGISPALMTHLGLGLGGAAVGAAIDPFNNRLESALAGGAVGVGLAHVPQLLQSLGASSEALQGFNEKIQTPGGIKSIASNVVQTLPQIQRFNYLMSGAGLPANAVVGPYGSAIMGALEHALTAAWEGSGDMRGWNALKELANPLAFAKEFWTLRPEALELINAGEMGRSEGLSAIGHGKNLFAGPGVLMTQGDVTARHFLERAGFTPDEARRMTMTNEPEFTLPKGLTNLGKGRSDSTKALANILFPFRRTPANIWEQGMERFPGIGFVLQGERDIPDSIKQQIVQQLLSGGVAGASAFVGANLDPETAKIARRYITNFAGQYSLPASMGFTAGQAYAGEKPVIPAAVRGGVADLPLPTTQPITELANFISGNGPLPSGWTPTMVKEVQGIINPPLPKTPRRITRLRRP